MLSGLPDFKLIFVKNFVNYEKLIPNLFYDKKEFVYDQKLIDSGIMKLEFGL